MPEIFNVVYKFLKWLSSLTGLTYREVNIVIYFIVIPAFLFYLISRITKQKWFVIGFLVFVGISLLIIPDFNMFSNQLFDLSVDFLNWFDKIGLNYVQASVVICVFVPFIIILLLYYYKKKVSLKSDVQE